MEPLIKTAPVLVFFKKYGLKINWHVDCIIKSKSDTLISFLLKKVYFVPQSWPFSILAYYFMPFGVPGSL
jgi:hypothetical protein